MISKNNFRLPALFFLLGVVGSAFLLFSGCSSTERGGPGTEEIAADLVGQVAPAFPDNSRVLILGFYEGDGEELHGANDALSSDLAIELLKISDRDIKVVNRNMLDEALEELKFSLSELTNTEKAQELGGFLSADIIIKGLVSRDFVTVECTDVETLTLVSIGKYAASQRMVFAEDSEEGSSPSAAASTHDTPSSSGSSDSAALSSEEEKSLSILGDAGMDLDGHLNEVLRSFEEDSGIKVRFEEHPSLVDRLEELKSRDALPDIVLSPHPAIAYRYYKEGMVEDLSLWFSGELDRAYEEKWISAVEFEGALVGLPITANPKSLVWYNPQAFSRHGYKTPDTLDELHSLLARMSGNGHKPWSLGIESGSATGWVVTDWLEDMVLRTAGAQAYDEWVQGDLPFSSPSIRGAAEELQRLWAKGEYLLQSPNEIVSTPFGDSANPLLGQEPGAYLHRQAIFMLSFMPPAAAYGENIDFFTLPGKGEKAPMLIGGEILVPMEDSPGVRSFFRFFLEPDNVQPLFEDGSRVSPLRDVELSNYPESMQKAAEELEDASVVRFDASDMMPPEVNRTFWEEMTSWAGEETSLDKALQKIDESWDR